MSANIKLKFMNEIQEITQYLTARKRTVACCGKSGLLHYMKALGFVWKEGKTDGHKVFVHASLSKLTNNRFTSHSIDCGHAPKRSMKLPYVVNTISLLKKYESELLLYLEDIGK